MREDLVKSAVAFLNDPKVADATLAKRIEFLESKGLNKEEIQEALQRANNGESGASSGSTTTSSSSSAPAVPYRPSYAVAQPPPPLPTRDWKDYFVMATVSCGVAYGIYEVARRYVLPLVVPPTPSSLEADKEALEAEFARTEALVEQLQKDTAEIKESEEKRRDEFKKMVDEAYDAIENLKSQSERRESDMKLIKSHVESVKDSLPKALERHRTQQDTALKELQNELRSLKQLVQNRVNRTGPPIPPASSVPSSLPLGSRSVSGGQPLGSPGSGSSTPGPLGASAASTASTGATTAPTSTPAPSAATSNPAANATNSAAPSDRANGTPSPRPGIPAWQLAAANKAKEAEAASN